MIDYLYMAANVDVNVDKILQQGQVKYRNPNPLAPQHPYRLTSAGKTDTGKSYSILKHIVLDPHSPFDKVIWCAPAKSLEQTKLQNALKFLKGKLVLVEGLDEDKLREMIDNKKAADQWLIVFDDLIGKVESPFISELFTSGRHSNISVIEILQRIFTGSKGRTHRLNSEYFMLHSFSDNSEVERLMRALAKRGVTRTGDLMQAYNDSVDKEDGRGFLLVDTKAGPRHSYLRYRDSDLDQAWINGGILPGFDNPDIRAVLQAMEKYFELTDREKAHIAESLSKLKVLKADPKADMFRKAVQIAREIGATKWDRAEDLEAT